MPTRRKPRSDQNKKKIITSTWYCDHCLCQFMLPPILHFYVRLRFIIHLRSPDFMSSDRSSIMIDRCFDALFESSLSHSWKSDRELKDHHQTPNIMKPKRNHSSTACKLSMRSCENAKIGLLTSGLPRFPSPILKCFLCCSWAFKIRADTFLFFPQRSDEAAPTCRRAHPNILTSSQSTRL